MRRWIPISIMCLAFFAASPSAPLQARSLAVVVGVSEYPYFPADKHLKGPANDVRRMKTALEARGVASEDLVVLADGVAGSAGLPTRAAILAQMARLAETASAGDLVIFYASGHGSRQPSDTHRKVDGLDQVFLPRDAAPPPPGGARTRFANVIAGPDFGTRLDAIRGKGADVWFILDSCFSGSASRGDDEGVHEKKLEPEDIGLSVSGALAPDETMVLDDLQRTLPAGAGRLVAFYASQPNETAREVALPLNVSLEKRSWGSIFTTALTDVLKRSPAMSYRQAMVETGRVLRANPGFQARQTPSFDGDGLDGRVPGAQGESIGKMWRVSSTVLFAGQIDGVESGAIVALYDSLTQPADRPTGYARVADADGLQARILALKENCLTGAANCETKVQASSALARAAYARLAKPAPAMPIGIARPRSWPGFDDPDGARRRRATELLDEAVTGPLAGQVVNDETSPALTAWVTRTGLRIMPASADPSIEESGPVVPDLQQADATMLVARAILRARQFALLKRLADTNTASDLGLSVEARHFGLDSATHQCAFKTEGKAADEAEAVKMCDKVRVVVENQSSRAAMAAVFFVDDGWNIIARRPQCPTGLTVSDRLEPGRRLVFDVPYHTRSIQPGLAPTTTNGVIVIGVPFIEGVTDLPSLCAMTALNDGPSDTARGDAQPGLEQLFEGSTRGTGLQLESASLSITSWQVDQANAR
jgi:hypothetical protein